MAIDLETLATAAASSIFVTLVVEYFAKPRLEARKEEILDAHRARRELLPATIRIAYAAAAVSTALPKAVDPGVRGNVYAEQDRQYQRLEVLVQDLVDDVGRRAGTFLAPYLDLVVGYTSTLQGLLMSSGTPADRAARVREVAEVMALVLSPPRLWQLWKAPAYQENLAKARSLIRGYTEELP